MPMKQKEVQIIIEPKDMYVGSDTASVTLTMFGDYESDECAAANEVVKALLKKYPEQLRLNFRHFPLTRIHQRAMKAGEAAVAAGQEGKFWPMHNMMFDNRRNLGTITLKSYAKEIGVTNKHFLEELMNSTYGWQVRGDLSTGLERGVRDVPTFFVNDVLVTGKPTLLNLSTAIDKAILTAKKSSRKKTLAK